MEVRVRQWVQEASRAYGHSQRVQQDIEAIMAKGAALRVDRQEFVYENGQAVSLIVLVGTVPMLFAGQQYNIPVKIWLPRNYPQTPPMVFVEPTSSMLIKPSKHVDTQGKLYMPYLHHWHSNPAQANLVTLVALMSEVFSSFPPVYSKPANYQPPPPVTRHSGSFRSASGNPPTSRGEEVRVNLTIFSDVEPFRVISASPSETVKAIITKAVLKYELPSDFPENFTLKVQEKVLQLTDIPLAIKTEMRASDPSADPLFTAVSLKVLENLSLEEKVGRESLVSAVGEKYHRRMYQIKAMANMEVDHLVVENADLKDREVRLLSGLSELNNAVEAGKVSLVQIQEKNQEVLETLERLSKNPEFDVDEGIITTAPIYEQLMGAVAHDLAIDDALYHLRKALDKEVIDSATFLKTVRSLAREQFFQRALAIKIREYLNMPPA